MSELRVLRKVEVLRNYFVISDTPLITFGWKSNERRAGLSLLRRRREGLCVRGMNELTENRRKSERFIHLITAPILMVKRENKHYELMRVTLSIGLIGIFLTLLYIVKNFYPKQDTLLSEFMYKTFVTYNFSVIIAFSLYLIIKASEYKFINKREVHDFYFSQRTEKTLYHTAVDLTLGAPILALFSLIMENFPKYLTSHTNLSILTTALISLLVFILLIAVVMHLYFKYIRPKQEKCDKQ